MPPKKMSAAEKEALAAAQEEEERLALEAELARLEEERLQREEEERQLRAAQIAFREDEIASLAKESEEAQLEAMATASKLRVDDEAEALEDNWRKHVGCDPLPDPTSESDVNTFVSIAMEEQPAELSEALELCALTEEVARGVDTAAAEAEATGDVQGTRLYHSLSLKLRATTAARLDIVTQNIATRPDEFLEGGSGHSALVSGMRGGVKCGIWGNVVTRPFRGAAKPVAFKDVGLQVDIPKAINVLKIALRVAHAGYDALSATTLAPPEADGMLVLGGVVAVDMFYLSPPPKAVKPSWTMRASTELAAGALQRVPYGDEAGASAILAQIKVHYEVPEEVFLVPSEAERHVLFWDPGAAAWTTEGVPQDEHSIQYSEAHGRSLQFLTNKSGRFALAQSKALDLPYRAWTLEPALEVFAEDSEIDVDKDEEGCVHFSLKTKRGHAVKVQVTAGRCQLLEPNIPGLYLLPLGPGELLHRLRRAGLNLLPTDADAARALDDDGVGVVVKSPALEAKTGADMAALASAFDFASTRWNKTLGAGRVAFRSRETSVYTGGNLQTLDMRMLLVEADTESESFRVAPDVGSLAPPGMKCAVIQQGEELGVPPPPLELEGEVEEKKEEEGEAKGREGKDGKEEEKEPEPWKEVFNDQRLAGTKTHILLKTALKGLSSAESLERFERTTPQLARTVAQLLKLTRPFSFC